MQHKKSSIIKVSPASRPVQCIVADAFQRGSAEDGRGRIRSGRLVFKDGDRDNQSVYLLEGEISLLAGNEIVGAVTAGSDASRHPIAQQQPRQVSARAKTNVVVARVDSSLLDIMLTWDQSSGYVVSEISDDDDDDWMTRILQSQAFLKLPPSNIQRLLMWVESVPVQAGDSIIQQGGEGDFFYIIKNGRCMVTRRPSANAKEVKLAELADGDAFGEDALVSLLRDEPSLARGLADGRLVAGPLGTFLAARLGLRERAPTDPSLGQRLLLLDFHDRSWNGSRAAAFGLPLEALPPVAASVAEHGALRFGSRRLPLRALSGDVGAAVRAVSAGDAGTRVLGTGGFVVVPTGGRPRRVPGLLASILWNDARNVHHVVEGTVHGLAASLLLAAKAIGFPADDLV